MVSPLLVLHRRILDTGGLTRTSTQRRGATTGPGVAEPELPNVLGPYDVVHFTGGGGGPTDPASKVPLLFLYGLQVGAKRAPCPYLLLAASTSKNAARVHAGAEGRCCEATRGRLGGWARPYLVGGDGQHRECDGRCVHARRHSDPGTRGAASREPLAAGVMRRPQVGLHRTGAEELLPGVGLGPPNEEINACGRAL